MDILIRPVRLEDAGMIVGILKFVSLSERRQGIGARLAEVTFEAARRQGFEKVLTYVRADNLDSLAFPVSRFTSLRYNSN